jgi:cell division protein FtsL
MKNKIKTMMKKNRRKRIKKRPWYLFLIVGILFLSYIFLLGNHGLIRYYQLQKRKQALIRQIAELKEEQIKLKKEIDMLQNNYRYIEKIAREKYQMGKADEKIYFMIPPAEKAKNHK